MYLLGVNLPDLKVLKVALTAFPGIGHTTARRICARLSFHSQITVGELTPVQVNALSALLSSPSTASQFHAKKSFPILPPTIPGIANSQDAITVPISGPQFIERKVDRPSRRDLLEKIPILQDLRRLVRNNIARHRLIGTYRGRRHAMRLPVRGQRTTTNHRTARRLNQVERYA